MRFRSHNQLVFESVLKFEFWLLHCEIEKGAHNNGRPFYMHTHNSTQD